MKAIVCQTHDEYEQAAKGAIFPWRYAQKKAEGGHAGHIMLICPGCGESSGMLVYDTGTPRPNNEGPCWEISGYPDAITLKPSIHHNNGVCGYHGYLTNGEFSF